MVFVSVRKRTSESATQKLKESPQTQRFLPQKANVPQQTPSLEPEQNHES